MFNQLTLLTVPYTNVRVSVSTLPRDNLAESLRDMHCKPR